MNRERKFLLAITFFGSLWSLLYELNLAKCVAHLTGDMILWESMTLGIFLGSVGLGVLEQSRRKGTWEDLFLLELKLSLGGALSVPLILVFHMIYRIYLIGGDETEGMTSLTLFGVFSQIPSLFLGFYSGRELPLLLSLQDEGGNRNSSFLLAASYFGALLASCLFTLVFQKWEFSNLALSAAFGNTLLAALIFRKGGRRSFRAYQLGACLLVLVGGFFFQEKLNEWHQKNFYYNQLRFSFNQDGLRWEGPVGLDQVPSFADRQRPIKRVRSRYQFIDYVWQPAPQAPDSFSVYLNGHYQFSSAREQNYHRTMVHGPIEITGRVPQNVLVLGAGDGLLVRELLTYESVHSITLVELDPQMLKEASLEPLSKLNGEAFNHGRVKLIVADAFRWLRSERDRNFDAIFADFPYPFDGDTSRLFSLEFYRLLKKSLGEKGFFVANYPLLEAPGSKPFELAYQTVHQAGFRGVWWLKFPGESFLLAGETLGELRSSRSGIQALALKGGPSAVAHSVFKPRRIIAMDPFF